MIYAETVTCSRWFALALYAPAAALGVLGLWLLLSPAGPVAGLVVLASAAPLPIAARLFGALRIEVDERALRARFGPFGPTLAGEDVEEARAEPYRWRSWGGWGLRWSRVDGRGARACSVPFLRGGVAVDTRRGRRYYFSSSRPDGLAAAVNRLAGNARGA